MISGKRALFIIPALILSVVPAHAAKPIIKSPNINVTNAGEIVTNYFKNKKPCTANTRFFMQ